MLVTQAKSTKLLGMTVDDNQKWKTQNHGKGGVIPKTSILFMIQNQSQHLLTKDLFIIKSLRMKSSLVKLLGLGNAVNKMVAGCLRMMKVAILAV